MSLSIDFTIMLKLSWTLETGADHLCPPLKIRQLQAREIREVSAVRKTRGILAVLPKWRLQRAELVRGRGAPLPRLLHPHPVRRTLV